MDHCFNLSRKGSLVYRGETWEQSAALIRDGWDRMPIELTWQDAEPKGREWWALAP